MLITFRSVLAAFMFLCFNVVVFTKNSDKTIYRAEGETGELFLDSVSGSITSVTWKHGADMAVEFSGGSTEAYRQFKGRSQVNSSTGALTITGLTRGDSGVYTAEINYKEQETKIQLLVISRVSKPTVSTSCNSGMTSCVYTCEANITGAEPVTYSWKLGDKLLDTETENITITKEEPESKMSIRCELKNPVSSDSSKSLDSPFHIFDRNRIVTIVFVGVALLGLIGGVGVLAFMYIKKLKSGEWKPAQHQGTSPEKEGLLPKATTVYAVSFHQSPNSSHEAEGSNGPEAPETSNHVQNSVPNNITEAQVIIHMENTSETDMPEGSNQNPTSECSLEAERTCLDDQETATDIPRTTSSTDNNREEGEEGEREEEGKKGEEGEEEEREEAKEEEGKKGEKGEEGGEEGEEGEREEAKEEEGKKGEEGEEEEREEAKEEEGKKGEEGEEEEREEAKEEEGKKGEEGGEEGEEGEREEAKEEEGKKGEEGGEEGEEAKEEEGKKGEEGEEAKEEEGKKGEKGEEGGEEGEEGGEKVKGGGEKGEEGAEDEEGTLRNLEPGPSIR
uniref:Ig-like domain-containing protein n=1 Tax=Anabas testudineus TaxID=64144 RepID=A0AAQ6IPE4_ANATE